MIVSNVVKSRSLVKVMGVCVLGLGVVLGGCNNKLKDENAALMSQNQALIAENNQMKANESAMQGQIATLQQQSAAKPADYTPPSDGGNARSRDAGNDAPEVFVVAGDVLFDSGSATLKSSAKKELASIANRIKSRHSGQRVRVEGYTDSDPIRKSKWKTNDALSEARAESVRAYLVSQGVSSGRISAVGMGAAKPKATKKDSRRVEIVVVGD